MTATFRLAAPTPRPVAYDLYWTFASRRHAAFERRLAGDRRPWTDDLILDTFKFCNVFRALDRVSQYMIRNVAYAADDSAPADRIFQIVAFRTFSNVATWEGVRGRLGRAPTIEDLRSGRFGEALEAVRAARGGLYTGAFILCANKAYGFDEKHRNHVGLFRHMFVQGDLPGRIRGANSFEAIVRALEAYPLMGPFMAYQTAIDLNYSDLLGFDEDDYTQAGPGAMRGLRKAFLDLGDFSPADAIQWMVDRQEREFDRLGLPFAGLFGRRLHAIDCQGLFCELDKYCREALPELASNRSRIKARFTASGEPLDLFFPPKWNLQSGTGATVPVAASLGPDPQFDLDLGVAPSGSRSGRLGPRPYGSSRRSAAPIEEDASVGLF